MDWLVAHAQSVGVLCGAALAAWAFLSKIDASYKKHLKDEFATKQDFHRLEDKLDSVLMAAFKTARGRPRAKKRSRTAS